MRRDAKLFLDRRISRRAFVSRVTRAGVAAGAATALARALEPQRVAAAQPAAGRMRRRPDRRRGDGGVPDRLERAVHLRPRRLGGSRVSRRARRPRAAAVRAGPAREQRSWRWPTATRARRARPRSSTCIPTPAPRTRSARWRTRSATACRWSSPRARSRRWRAARTCFSKRRTWRSCRATTRGGPGTC